MSAYDPSTPSGEYRDGDRDGDDAPDGVGAVRSRDGEGRRSRRGSWGGRSLDVGLREVSG
jgi:hypothetical protein